MAVSELAVLAAVPAAHGGLSVPELILLAVAGVVVWALSLLVKPFGPCWLCRGKRVRVVRGRRKARKCWACKGVGRRQRLGSRTVHRIRRTAMSAWRDEPARRGGAS